jgi:hypothetical protein
MPREGHCRFCRSTFDFPDTGPRRVYCNAVCRDAAHADRLSLRLSPLYDGEILPGILPDRMPPPAGSDFGLRFRDADPVARSYASVLRLDPCSYCGAVGVPMEADHIEPFITGGSGSFENLTAVCKECNSSKCASPLLWWLLASARMQKLRHPQLALEV